MCPSTLAKPVTGVYLEHLKAPGSRFCLVSVDIHVACGCVLTTSAPFYKATSSGGRSLPMMDLILKSHCAQHQGMRDLDPMALVLASRGSIAEVNPSWSSTRRSVKDMP